MSQHHDLDIYPNPKSVLFINETGIADISTCDLPKNVSDRDEEDNVRIYIPLDLNQEAMIRRLKNAEYRLGNPTEYNEMDYCTEFQKIITQLEIYDQVWCTREGNFPKEPDEHWHSRHANEIVEKLLYELESLAECSSAERFPYDEIDSLEEEYKIIREHDWK